MPFKNPIVAGTKLIRQAIKSPDYIAGVSGWSINRDGTAEFNDAVIRGELVAGGGVVTLNNTGLRFDGNLYRVEANQTDGFIIHNVPDNGSYAQILTYTGQYGGILWLQPPDSTVSGDTLQPGYVSCLRDIAGSQTTPKTTIASPTTRNKEKARIDLWGTSSTLPFDDTAIDLRASQILVTGLQSGNFVNGADNTTFLRGETGQENVSFTTQTSFTVAVAFTSTWQNAPRVFPNINSSSGTTLRWAAKAYNITATGFTLQVYSTNAVASTWASVPVDWVALANY